MNNVELKIDLTSITKWMEEVTAILCYQPDIPLNHKTDLINALNEHKQRIISKIE